MTIAVIALALTAAGLAVALVIEEAAHRKERKDLIDRLMARDTSEYIRIVNAGEKRESARAKKAQRWRKEE